MSHGRASVVHVDLLVLADDVIVVVAMFAVLAVHSNHQLALRHFDDVLLLTPRADGLHNPMLVMAHAIASLLTSFQYIAAASKQN